MGIINRVFSFLIFILAIAAAVFAFLLSQKRESLLNSKNELAQTVNSVAGALDTNSGTNYKMKTNPDNLKSLEDIKDAASKAQKQAKEIVAQRDELSNRLKDISETLAIPDFRETDFQSVEEYSDKSQALVSEVTKIKERNDEIVKAVAKSGEKMGLLVSAGQLQGDKYADSLKKYNDKVGKFKQKHDHLVSHAKDVAENLGLNSPRLNSSNYKAMLQTSIEEVKSFKDEADKTVNDLKRTKNQFARARKQLEKAQQDISSLKGKTKEQQEKLAKTSTDLQNAIKQIGILSGKTPGEAVSLTGKPGEKGGFEPINEFRKLKGKVINVNRKWGFVVINLGKKNELEETGQNVSLPPNQDMIIARGMGEDNQFVGKIKIAKVFEQCAVGNILADPKALPVQVGDEVYFGEEEKEEEPEEEEKAEEAAPKADDKAEAAPAAKAAPEKKEADKDKDEEEEKDEDEGDDDDDDDDKEEDLEEFEEEEDV